MGIPEAHLPRQALFYERAVTMTSQLGVKCDGHKGSTLTSTRVLVLQLRSKLESTPVLHAIQKLGLNSS